MSFSFGPAMPVMSQIETTATEEKNPENKSTEKTVPVSSGDEEVKEHDEGHSEENGEEHDEGHSEENGEGHDEGHDTMHDEKLFKPVATFEQHEFSIPWRNSDLVLIIEEKKIHVHRLILEMASPVLYDLFMKTDSKEVPLLRTKVNHFVQLLRVIYPQFESKITLDNVEHIYRLSEEYQVESATRACREYLSHTKKNGTNAMTILVAAQVCNAEEARQQCYKELQQLTVTEMKLDRRFQDLDEQSLRRVLLPRAERLEKCLRHIEPQLVGLIDCVLYLWLDEINPNNMGGKPIQCPVHHASPVANTSMKTRIKCFVCKEMFNQMAKNSMNPKPTTNGFTLCRQTPIKAERRKSPSPNPNPQEFPHSLWDTRLLSAGHNSSYYSSSGMYFDEDVVSVLQEMFNVLKTKSTDSEQHKALRFGASA